MVNLGEVGTIVRKERQTKPIRLPRQKVAGSAKSFSKRHYAFRFETGTSFYHEIQPPSVVLRVRSIQFGQEIVKD